MSKVKKKIISLEVRDEFILGSGVAIGAQGSFNSVVLEVKFDENWNDLPNKYVTWTDALGNDGVQQPITTFNLVDGEVDVYRIPVPQFATNYAGTVKLSFSGFALGGENSARTVEVLANTASGAFRVLESNATVIDEDFISPTQAQEFINEINEFIDEVNGVIGNFYGRIDTIESNEETRQTAEFGAVGNKWNEDGTAVVEKDGITVVPNSEAGRVGAELERQKGYTEMKSLIGDIDSAVDAILAIQLKLIGGAS